MLTTESGRWRHLAWGLVLALASVSASAGKVDKLHPGKLSEKVRERIKKAKRTAKVDVVVRFRRTPATEESMLIQGLGGSVRRPTSAASRWMSIRIPAQYAEDLAESNLVDFVASDEPVHATMDVARQTSSEPPVSAPESAFKGAGVTIAMVDSGVALHPDIQTLIAAVDLTPSPIQSYCTLLDDGSNAQQTSPANSVDPNGHGTHVAGILVGNGGRSPEGRLAGIAPQANLVSVRVLDDVGQGLTSDVLAGLQWILAHKDEYGIRIANVSLGHPVYEPAEFDPLVQAVDALWDAGVVVACSAGNAGRDGYVTITSPCNSRKVITVGASNDHQTPEITDDTITTYSSRGPAALDLMAKPDLVAPGNRIVSLRSPGSYVDTLFPDRRVAADPAQPDVAEYFEMSGTSMSAPIVAGTVALMLEQDPSLNPGTVKARLMMSARKPAVGDPLVTGAGLLDILGALQATGFVVDAPSPRTIVDSATGLIGFENTAVLWGNEAFSLMALWPASVIWTDPTAAYQPILWSAGELWPASEVWPETELWPEDMSEVWPENELWPDTEAWIPQLTSPAESEPVAIEPLAVGYQDP
ncbi:MAG TPA: S8 family peptidase [Candidatus Dormibacteraeota bacterium]|jgi:serine protease AprX|nr:S8 family peptidase [Candidatus Dormibacteraeota bacterium]